MEKSLPSLPKWGNTLCGEKITMTTENLQHGKNVFEEFRCQNLGEYHDLCLTSVTLCQQLFLSSFGSCATNVMA